MYPTIHFIILYYLVIVMCNNRANIILYNPAIFIMITQTLVYIYNYIERSVVCTVHVVYYVHTLQTVEYTECIASVHFVIIYNYI